MFIQFLKVNPHVKYLLTLIRIYLGWTWLKAGFGKITEGKFDASGFLKGALSKTTGEHPAVQGWWGNFIETIALPNVEFFNILVPWGEFLVGLALLLGLFTTFATLMGVIMNFSYMFSGTTSTNPQMLLLEIIILIAGFNAAKIGVDYWILPFVKEKFLNREPQNLTT
ncbi:DoxX family protein [Bacillus methanolicus PB1]|uniref:DoxX family protein n=1 Tax=Bacillus methanolicus PB1 TaxID=997296 RepID=I3DUS5_BACMT|nr:DoxX family membrane protein [Bacillus methanolicus]EIJ77996.1 DoxX family protein [Bacillus methanolicus PB1]